MWRYVCNPSFWSFSTSKKTFTCFSNQQQKPKSFVPLGKAQFPRLETNFHFLRTISALHFTTLELPIHLRAVVPLTTSLHTTKGGIHPQRGHRNSNKSTDQGQPNSKKMVEGISLREVWTPKVRKKICLQFPQTLKPNFWGS